MKNSENVTRFWARFCSTNGIDPTEPYQVWYFGNTPEMAKELAELVISGKKQATASLLETNKIEPDKAPIDNGYSVVTTFEGEPLCVIRTTEIRHLPFLEVDAQFAFDEGEGDQTVEDWRQGHRAYFAREAEELGFDFNENSVVCCERFKLLFPK